MRAVCFIYALAAFAVSVFVGVNAASAQATRTWVSGVGDDVNPCSRTAPCKTFAGAISKTAASGEINCLDPAGFGTVTITKSITIDCTGTLGSILAGSTTGVIVNGANIKVTLRGLTINGAPVTSPGVNGVRLLQGASLVIQDCFIQNFGGAAPNGFGVIVNNTSLTPELIIDNTQFVRNGTATTGGGIGIVPTGTGGATVAITNSSLSDNDTGLRVTSATTGVISVTGAHVTISGNRVGVAAGGTGATQVNLTRAVVSGSQLGLTATAPTIIRVGDSIVTANDTGVSGNVFSYGNNQMAGNTTLGSTTPVGLQSMP